MADAVTIFLALHPRDDKTRQPEPRNDRAHVAPARSNSFILLLLKLDGWRRPRTVPAKAVAIGVCPEGSQPAMRARCACAFSSGTEPWGTSRRRGTRTMINYQ
jgi:hypothetical protein